MIFNHKTSNETINQNIHLKKKRKAQTDMKTIELYILLLFKKLLKIKLENIFSILMIFEIINQLIKAEDILKIPSGIIMLSFTIIILIGSKELRREGLLEIQKEINLVKKDIKKRSYFKAEELSLTKTNELQIYIQNDFLKQL